ncbi:MAG: hypothetical protein FJX64_03175 [Alphaproteobacteria bacterium]|nr:hypothetical protein [Alphaproteobacteria bacterium]
MTRAGVIFGGAVVLSALLSIGVYAMKYEVERLNAKVAELGRTLQRQGQTLQVLEAEWSFLNRPDRLSELTARHLELRPVAVRQLGALEAIPLRSDGRVQDAALAATQSREPPLRLTPAVSPAQATPAGKREAP